MRSPYKRPRQALDYWKTWSQLGMGRLWNVCHSWSPQDLAWRELPRLGLSTLWVEESAVRYRELCNINLSQLEKVTSRTKLFLTSPWDRNCMRWTITISSVRDILSSITSFTKTHLVEIVLSWCDDDAYKNWIIEHIRVFLCERPPWSWISFPWGRIILTLYSDNCTPVIVEVTQQLTIFIRGNPGLICRKYTGNKFLFWISKPLSVNFKYNRILWMENLISYA